MPLWQFSSCIGVCLFLRPSAADRAGGWVETALCGECLTFCAQSGRALLCQVTWWDSCTIGCDTHCQLTIQTLPFRIILFSLCVEEVVVHNMLFLFSCPVDGEWCRAMVNELSEDKVSVNFVDYGYSMNLEKNHLRSITPQLLTLPFQAIRCSLAGSVKCVCECERKREGEKLLMWVKRGGEWKLFLQGNMKLGSKIEI